MLDTIINVVNIILKTLLWFAPYGSGLLYVYSDYELLWRLE